MMQLVKTEYDPKTGFTEKFWYDTDKDRVTIERTQDVEGQLKFNRACHNSHSGGYGDSVGGAHHVARIPLVILEKWKREEGFDWFNSTDKERKARLNDPDNRFLRVRPGRL